MDINISEKLTGGVNERARDLVEYLRSYKMLPKRSATQVWGFAYQTFPVCYVRINKGTDYWEITLFIGEYGGEAVSGEMKEIILANRKPCSLKCKGGNCFLQIHRFFGDDCEICESATTFYNPGLKEIECVKKLIDLRVEDVQKGNAKKHVYIPIGKRT